MLVSLKLARGMRLREDAIRLTASQRQLLAELVRSGPIQPSRLVTALDKHSTAIARTISELSERGLVERRADQRDRRSVHVELTEAGRLAYHEELASRIVPLAGQLSTLDPHAVDTLHKALELIEKMITD